MSFKYNIASIYAFMLPWQHHTKAGDLGFIVLICDIPFNNSRGNHVICKLVGLTLKCWQSGIDYTATDIWKQTACCKNGDWNMFWRWFQRWAAWYQPGGWVAHPHPRTQGCQHAQVPRWGRAAVWEHHGRSLPGHQSPAARLRQFRGTLSISLPPFTNVLFGAMNFYFESDF